MSSIDLMLGTHFTMFGIEIGKCNQDSNNLFGVFWLYISIDIWTICGR